jgi:cytoskeletal protein CcmA (bactofilin family)
MAATHATTVIGRGTFVRGRVTGTGDLEIAGHIEGDVTCTGEVLVDASGLVAASISARRIVVRGAVKGDLTAEDVVLLEGSARVVGDLRAPRIAIAQGGLVRGHVQTGGAGATRPRAASASAAKPAPKVIVAAAPARTEPKKAAVVERASTSNNGVRTPARAGVAGSSARIGPPPPVVPALKKGTKAVAHHKKR